VRRRGEDIASDKVIAEGATLDWRHIAVPPRKVCSTFRCAAPELHCCRAVASFAAP